MTCDVMSGLRLELAADVPAACAALSLSVNGFSVRVRQQPKGRVRLLNYIFENMV